MANVAVAGDKKSPRSSNVTTSNKAPSKKAPPTKPRSQPQAKPHAKPQSQPQAKPQSRPRPAAPTVRNRTTPRATQPARPTTRTTRQNPFSRSTTLVKPRQSRGWNQPRITTPQRTNAQPLKPKATTPGGSVHTVPTIKIIRGSDVTTIEPDRPSSSRKRELDALLTGLGTQPARPIRVPDSIDDQDFGTKPELAPGDIAIAEAEDQAQPVDHEQTTSGWDSESHHDHDDHDHGHGHGHGHGHDHDHEHHHNDCWRRCAGDGFNLWFRFGSPLWCRSGWGFGYIENCGWWWWARDGFCSPSWRSPWYRSCWWSPSVYAWSCYRGWSTWNVSSTIVVQQSSPLPAAQTSTTQSGATTPAPMATTPGTGDAIVLERPDGSIVIASPSQAWLYLGYGETTLAADLFAAMLQEEPNATEYLLGYTLALACSPDANNTKLAALALEEVLRLDAGVLLNVPLDRVLREQLNTLKLRLLLDARGVDLDPSSVLLLAAVRTILGEEISALAAVSVAEQIFGATPGSTALRTLLEQLRTSNQISMR